MAQSERVDMLVLGSGEAGKYLAWHMAHAGHRTAVVERQWVGGSCPNINCLPSKNEIWSAKVADLVHHAAAFGTVTGPGSVDMARVRQRKRDMVEGLIAMHLERYLMPSAQATCCVRVLHMFTSEEHQQTRLMILRGGEQAGHGSTTCRLNK